jgi:hypothetical protein
MGQKIYNILNGRRLFEKKLSTASWLLKFVLAEVLDMISVEKESR